MIKVIELENKFIHSYKKIRKDIKKTKILAGTTTVNTTFTDSSLVSVTPPDDFIMMNGKSSHIVLTIKYCDNNLLKLSMNTLQLTEVLHSTITRVW